MWTYWERPRLFASLLSSVTVSDSHAFVRRTVETKLRELAGAVRSAARRRAVRSIEEERRRVGLLRQACRGVGRVRRHACWAPEPSDVTGANSPREKQYAHVTPSGPGRWPALAAVDGLNASGDSRRVIFTSLDTDSDGEQGAGHDEQTRGSSNIAQRSVLSSRIKKERGQRGRLSSFLACLVSVRLVFPTHLRLLSRTRSRVALYLL